MNTKSEGYGDLRPHTRTYYFSDGDSCVFSQITSAVYPKGSTLVRLTHKDDTTYQVNMDNVNYCIIGLPKDGE
jgi:hypothetical protein